VLRHDMNIDKVVNGVVLKTKVIKDQERSMKKRKLAKVIGSVYH